MDKIIVSGMRPTGKLHLGNYFGALKNWVDLQNTHNCYFFVADLHALTTAAERTENLAANSRQMVIDWLAAGLNPQKCVIFVQSHVPQVAQLNTLLGMITPLGWLLRNPTYKEQLNELYQKKYAGQLGNDEQSAAQKMAMLSEQELSEIASFGFLGYPVLMATDILLHRAQLVPVGQDQVVHLEIAKDIARKFADMYGADILIEPKPLLTQIPKVLGLDGRKMSKSYGNTIELGEDIESVRKKVMAMFTDPNKKKANDPANPDGCSVFAFHKIYNPNAAERAKECRAGSLGCVQCKKDLFSFMEPQITAFNNRRAEIAKDSAYVDNILKEGAAKACAHAQETLDKINEAMRLLK